jgi:hypothetical protein
MRRIMISTALVALAAAAGICPREARAQDTAPKLPPVGQYTPYSTEMVRPNRALLIGGGALFLGAYGTSAIIGVRNDREADEKLAIPVVGPWLDLNHRQCSQMPCEHETANKAALIASGALQGLGLVSVISSFFVTERHTHYGSAGPTHVAAKPHVNITPAQLGTSRSNYGLAVIGTF